MTGRPPGGGPPAANTLAMAGLSTDAVNSMYSSAVCTNTPRTPELPPEARQTYRSSSRPGSCAQAASCCSARARVIRAVGEQLVEARHHLLLGHYRQLGQLAELETRRVDPGQAPGVEGGALERDGEQRPQLLSLVRGQLLGIPAQPADVRRQAAGERLARNVRADPLRRHW